MTRSGLVPLDLASDGTGGELGGVGVGEETFWVGLEGGDGETSSRVGYQSQQVILVLRFKECYLLPLVTTPVSNGPRTHPRDARHDHSFKSSG